MNIAVLQLNPTVGDLSGNALAIIEHAKTAYANGARIVITPELAICGYPAEDLLLRPAFLQACEQSLKQIAQALSSYKDLYLIVGHPALLLQQTRNENQHEIPVPVGNAISIIHANCIKGRYIKQQLNNQGSSHESRYFIAGDAPLIFEVEDVLFAVLMGDDLNAPMFAQRAINLGAQVLLVCTVQAFALNQQYHFEQKVAKIAQKISTPIIVTQMVGGQDECIFEGASFAYNSSGEVAARAKQFEQTIVILQLTAEKQIQGNIEPLYQEDETLWRALVLGVKDYMRKNGFSQAMLGLSGGMDSALVLAIATDAIGAQNIHAFMMPSPYTADISCTDASEIAQRLGVRYDSIMINDTFDTLRQALTPVFAHVNNPPKTDTTEENLQARIRGTLLMAISNKTGALLLTTGNKSELATGYCTLYGDMAGGFAVIKDLVKTRVYQLARWRNANDLFQTGSNPIPQRIITRAPSAELRADQVDQDNLPSYEVLDAIIERYIEKNQSVQEIITAGYDATDVEKVTRLIWINEYKRRQAPIGIKLTPRALGSDWQHPITSKFRA